MRHVRFLVFYFLISNVGICQKYTPFNLDNGEWYCKYFTKGGIFEVSFGDFYGVDSVKFFCSGDTVFNDVLFKKLYYIGYSCSYDIPRTYISGYYGGIRNDTVNRKVWFYKWDKSFLMYDFNINIGDSICYEGDFCFPILFYICGKVISIDSVMYCNKYYKRYNVEGDQNHIRSIIEGIGSPDGLFPIISPTWNSWLICYSERNNNECETCMTFTDIENNTIVNINISTNPVSNQINISSDYIIKSVELFDLFGRLVYNKNNINSDNTIISILNSGIFILKVRVADKIVVRKIIKN